MIASGDEPRTSREVPDNLFRKDPIMTRVTMAATADRTTLRSALTFATLFGLALLVLAGCATTTAVEPITVPQIIKMNQAGLTPPQIIGVIKNSGTVYRLKASQLADLEKKGLPPSVIDYMQNTYVESVRRDQSMADWDRWALNDDGYWYAGCPFRWGFDDC